MSTRGFVVLVLKTRQRDSQETSDPLADEGDAQKRGREREELDIAMKFIFPLLTREEFLQKK